MTTISRVRAGMSGFPGGPGVMTMYCLDPSTFLAPLRTWLAAVTVLQPVSVRYDIEATGDELEHTTGEITGTWTATAPATLLGGVNDTYSAPTGLLVHWLTDTHLSGRRLRGRSFIVPVIRNAFDTDGTVTNAALTTVNNASTTFLAAVASNFVVWQRPREAKPADGSRPAITARGGGYATVSSHRTPDKAVVLRSRRD